MADHAAIAVVIAVYILRWLYRRSTKEAAFVRTGFLGEKVVVNGGAFVIPVLHEITPVNMNVMRIEVQARERLGADHQEPHARRPRRRVLRARRRQPELVAAAAQTLGRRTLQPEGIRELLEGKFAAAMRTVAAQMTLEEMHEKRGDYASAGARDSAASCSPLNGLELESVAIVDLDQTSLEYFDPSNAFDAEGLTQLTESIENRRKMRNEIEQRTLVDIRNQNLDTQKKVLEIDRDDRICAAGAGARGRDPPRRAARRTGARARACATRKPSRRNLSSREAVEKSRLAQERNITEERIKTEEDTQRREIARRRSLDEAEMKTREKTEREQIALELELEKARIERERAQSELEIAAQGSAGDHRARTPDRARRKGAWK